MGVNASSKSQKEPKKERWSQQAHDKSGSMRYVDICFLLTITWAFDTNNDDFQNPLFKINR